MRFPEDDYDEPPDFVLTVEAELSTYQRDLEAIHHTARRLDLDHARQVYALLCRVRRFRHRLPSMVGAV